MIVGERWSSEGEGGYLANLALRVAIQFFFMPLAHAMLLVDTFVRCTQSIFIPSFSLWYCSHSY
jgi:hypothetical protein